LKDNYKSKTEVHIKDDIEIVIDGKVPKNAIIFEGFQGIGLVGTLAAQYIADKTNAKLIGYVNSSMLPPMALLINGEMKNPMKIYSFKKDGQEYMIFESELPIPQKLVYQIAKAIAKFACDNKVKEIVCLEGLATKQPPIDSKVYGVTNTKGENKKFEKNISFLQNGIIIGVSAALMMQSKMLNVPAFCLIAEAHSEYPDGLAAANIIKKINNIYDFNINVSELEKEAKKFEDKLWHVIEKAKEISDIDGESPKKAYIG
jgi:uncharacterized protein